MLRRPVASRARAAAGSVVRRPADETRWPKHGRWRVTAGDADPGESAESRRA